MELIELGITPFICFIMAVLVPLTSFVFGKRVGDVIAAIGSIICIALAIKIFSVANSIGITVYRFGGFPPPLGVAYIADAVNSVLALFTSFALFISLSLAMLTIDTRYRYLFHTLAYLLVAGVYGCLFTIDIFNLYVSIELIAISSYALTAFYRNRRAIRAAIIYGISGTVVTSFLLLTTLLIYGSYGTINMIDIALKVLDPGIITPLSGGVFGNIFLSSKIAIALATWTFLFKSGIVPNHFWLPETYSATPFPAIILFTAGADIIGVYGLLRLYYTVFPSGGMLDDYRNLFFNILLVIGIISAIISSMLVSRQTTIRKLIAYSSISQFSLALLGITTRTVEGISGSILHIIVNGLGDIAIIYSISILYLARNMRVLDNFIHILSKLVLVIGMLNLFGITPVLPGFWSKTFITLGFINASIPWGAAIVLISSGLCAIGYLRMVIRFFTLDKSLKTIDIDISKPCIEIISIAMLLIIISIITGIGLIFLISTETRGMFLSYGSTFENISIYIDSIIPMG